MKKNLKDKKSLNIAMLGHKRIPSREGGIEIVVEELATRMVVLYQHSYFKKENSMPCDDRWRIIKCLIYVSLIEIHKFGNLFYYCNDSSYNDHN